MRSFEKFVEAKEGSKAETYHDLEKGFIPPDKMRSIIRAFLNSGQIIIQQDSTKPVTMSKKKLFLVGGPVRDFISGKTPKDFDLATSATPAQVGMILSAAGFKYGGDRSGKQKAGTEFKVQKHFAVVDGKDIEVEDAQHGDKYIWFLKGRDSSADLKPFVVSAISNGEEFEIATFRKDAKVTDGAAEVDFVDNPAEDASRRDLTINALYIELTKPDGENKKLYDPTGKGMHDLTSKSVRTVGKAEDRFNEDPIRIMRALRFQCRFGKGGQLHSDIEKAIPKFLNLHERIAMERIREEFLKGLLHPDIDSKCYLSLYKRTGLLNTVFPGVNYNVNIPEEFESKKDKSLALAWGLQNNPLNKVAEVLSADRKWGGMERKAVLFLLKLNEFSPDDVHRHFKERAGTGLSNQQIEAWVKMHHASGSNRPAWSNMISKFSNYKPSVSWGDIESQGGHIGPDNLPVPNHERGGIVSKWEADKFKKGLGS